MGCFRFNSGMNDYDLKDARFWRNMLLTMAVHGHTHIHTNSGAHHKAFRPVAKAFEKVQQGTGNCRNLPPSLYQTRRHKTFPDLDTALHALVELKLAIPGNRDGIVRIFPGKAKRILDADEGMTPFECTTLSELARKYAAPT